ncbi:MAG: tripartite tricarboxylate transporter TctB family protein [Burkholderiales bacterium]
MTQTRDLTDIFGGALLMVIGLAAVTYTSGRYEIGEISEMGPGMFPTAIGYLLAGLGVLIAVPAFFREGVLPTPEYREFFTVTGSVLLFALTIDRLGLVAALLLLTVVAVAAQKKVNWLETFALFVVITIFAVLLFRVGLGMPLPLFKWGF